MYELAVENKLVSTMGQSGRNLGIIHIEVIFEVGHRVEEFNKEKVEREEKCDRTLRQPYILEEKEGKAE